MQKSNAAGQHFACGGGEQTSAVARAIGMKGVHAHAGSSVAAAVCPCKRRDPPRVCGE